MKISADQSEEVILKIVGRRLAERRIILDLTQAQLAQAAGVAKRTVERIEQGESAQLSTLVKVFRVLDLINELDALVPIPELSDPEEAQRRRLRMRATGKRTTPITSWKWLEEEKD